MQEKLRSIRDFYLSNFFKAYYRICNGDNRACKLITKKFSKTYPNTTRICDDDAELDSCDREFPLSLEDIDKFLIPADVTSISVSQKEGDKNLILVETGMGNRVIGTEYFENCENCKNKMIKYDAISASYFRVLMKEDFTRTWGVSSYGPLQAPMRIRILPRQYSINLIVTYYIPIKREGTLGSLRYSENIIKTHNYHAHKMEVRKLDRMLY